MGSALSTQGAKRRAYSTANGKLKGDRPGGTEVGVRIILS
jgi:hypothetical protein